MLFEADCQEQGGLWLGGAELCTPDPCVTSNAPGDAPDPSSPGADPQSWGRIKNLYREKTR